MAGWVNGVQLWPRTGPVGCWDLLSLRPRRGAEPGQPAARLAQSPLTPYSVEADRPAVRRGSSRDAPRAVPPKGRAPYSKGVAQGKRDRGFCAPVRVPVLYLVLHGARRVLQGRRCGGMEAGPRAPWPCTSRPGLADQGTVLASRNEDFCVTPRVARPLKKDQLILPCFSLFICIICLMSGLRHIVSVERHPLSANSTQGKRCDGCALWGWNPKPRPRHRGACLRQPSGVGTAACTPGAGERATGSPAGRKSPGAARRTGATGRCSAHGLPCRPFGLGSTCGERGNRSAARQG